MTNLGREPLQIVEIDIDFCQNTFGSAPCTASAAAGGECYNTFFTCQDQANFSNAPLTLRFSKNQRTGITGQIVFPALQSVSTNATKIALSRVDDKLGSLGKRARVQVSLQDFRWSDQVTDPYVATRTYDPSTQGTFFGRLRARFPYYYGRTLRVKNGYVGDDIATMPTRTYIITEWSGPDADGNVSITAQDPIKLTDEEFAQCPSPSNGRIETAISAGYLGPVNLIPATIGNEYSASGRVVIGSEIMTFTRSGDVLTITERGVDGTDAASHSADDTVQECYRAEDAKLQDIMLDLLQNFADVPVSMLPYADWNTELDRWYPSLRLTRTIPKPVAVKTLLGELGDFGVIFWWDEVDQEIKVKANRPPDYDEVFFEADDSGNILEKTPTRTDLDAQRLSQAWMYHGLVSSTRSVTSPESYRRLGVTVDLQAESPNEYGQRRILELFSPWLGSNGNEPVVQAITNRIVDRYRNTPQRITFRADIKDRDDLEIASLVKITSRVLQDATGAPLQVEMQVTSVEETAPGHIIEVTAEAYQFSGRYGFITENTRGDYDASSAFEISKGTYAVDEATLTFPDGTTPYVIF